MSEMVERVAQAIAIDNGDLNGYTSGTPLDGFDYESAAKAAIEAMREPTEGMRKAGEQWVLVTTVWQAMIKATLVEKEGQ